MSQLVYERPREKIRYRGARFLTVAELIQVIIGSGTAQVSGAKVARCVARQLKDEGLSYEQLLAVNGLGHAKVCQLLAAVELGKRVEDAKGAKGTLSPRSFEVFSGQVRSNGKACITCYWLDGSEVVIDYKIYPHTYTTHASVYVKRIIADALSVSARSLVVFYTAQNSKKRLDPYGM